MSTIGVPTPGPWVDWSGAERRLWRRWVVANGAGEVVGLGLVGVVAAVLVSTTGLGGGPVGPGAVAVVLVALGTLEGGIVGYAQWRAMRDSYPAVGAGRWVAATAAGAFVAWTLGVLPSTLSDAGSPAGPTNEPSFGVVLLLAAFLGAVGGIVLSGAQWLVLREHVDGAWRWLPANAIAWAIGMPVVFAGVALVPAGPPGGGAVAIVLGTAAVAGLVVGAIHGVELVRLARSVR